MQKKKNTIIYQILTVIFIWHILSEKTITPRQENKKYISELTRDSGWAELEQGQVLVHSETEPACASVSPVPPPQ